MIKTEVLFLLCLLLCVTVVSGAENVGINDGNLLDHTDVQDSLVGWNIAAMDEPSVFRGESMFRSSIYQDISVEGIPKGQKLKLSGRFAAAPDDPDQLVAEMGLAVYDAAENVICDMQLEQESSRELTGHEIIMEVPEGAAYARVCLAIYKRSTRNTFCFEELRLEGTAADTTLTVTNLNIPDDAVSWEGHYYSYFDDAQISWTMAENYCSIYNGHLVCITSAEEQAFLESAFPGTGGWIGASLREDGSWQWITGETFDYANWAPGEPDNKDGMEGFARLSADMKWEDLPDEDVTSHTGYYCEWDSNLVTYAQNDRNDGMIPDETKALLEEGKGFFYGTGPEGYDVSRYGSAFPPRQMLPVHRPGITLEGSWHPAGRIPAGILISGRWELMRKRLQTAVSWDGQVRLIYI